MFTLKSLINTFSMYYKNVLKRSLIDTFSLYIFLVLEMSVSDRQKHFLRDTHDKHSSLVVKNLGKMILTSPRSLQPVSHDK